MFNFGNQRIKPINNKTLAIILILIAGGSGTALAITNGSITTGNLIITGTCTGCGGGEGNYTNYNTIYLNQTYTPSAGGLFPQVFYLSNQPESLVNTNADVFVVDAVGTMTDEGATYGQSQTQVPTVQTTLTGQYKAMIVSDNGGSIIVFKDGNIIAYIYPELDNYFGSNLSSAALAISPNGQFVGLIAKDTGGTSLRLVIFEGN